MKEFEIRVQLPVRQDRCHWPDRCYFLLGYCYCVILDKTLPTDAGEPMKDKDCPAYEK